VADQGAARDRRLRPDLLTGVALLVMGVMVELGVFG